MAKLVIEGSARCFEGQNNCKPAVVAKSIRSLETKLCGLISVA
jgi:hypothetical protein